MRQSRTQVRRRRSRRGSLDGCNGIWRSLESVIPANITNLCGKRVSNYREIDLSGSEKHRKIGNFMMSDSGLDYTLPENHVEKRAGLSKELRDQIFEPVAEGHNSPHYGEAQFWLQIHQGLLRTSAVLPNWCSQFLGEKENERLLMMAPRICDLVPSAGSPCPWSSSYRG